jgi:hypothetical protein
MNYSKIFHHLGLASLLCLGLVLPARAQSGSDGSLYSRFGLGELYTFSSPQIQGMGGSGLGLRSFNYVNMSNPGSWSDQVLTRASAGFIYQNVAITDAADQTSRLASGSLNAVQFSFPILERRLGVGLGFAPYSRVGYRIETLDELISTQPSPDTTLFVTSFVGNGGLQRVVGGLGYRFNRYVSVGANAEVLFGIIDSGRRTSFIDINFQSTNVTTSTRMAGLTGTFGTLISLPNLVRDNDLLSLGAAFTLPARLAAVRVRTLGELEQVDRDTLGTRQEGTVDLPWSAGVGASYIPSNRWILSASAHYEPWSEFKSDLTFPGFTPGEAGSFSDRFRAGGGIEFLPAGADLLASYFARTAYRLGLSYDRSYASPVAGVDLRALAVTGGVSLPTMLPGTRLDINIEVGTRGTTEHGLVRDVFYRFAASLNVGERWFQKQQLR